MYVRICLTEQHLLRIAVGFSDENPPAQSLNFLPQRRPLVHQTLELGVHHAQELLDRLLLVTAPPQPRQRKRHGLQLLESQSEEHTSELQSRPHLVCRLLLEKKKPTK